jgi:hypothetical protein
MSDDIQSTIEVLSNKVRAKEEEAAKLKKLINELCTELGIDIRYPNVSDVGGSAAIRSDHFYGLPLTAAIRNYLEHRKASGLGAASVVDIYKAIKGGGYKFETKSDQNSQISVGNTLRKTSSIFHRLPNGQYGLLSWYPSAKAPVENGSETSTKPAKATKAKNPNLITNKEIRDFILAKEGEFKAADIESGIRAKLPTKELPKTKIPAVLFILKGKELIRQVSPKSGKSGAVYAKA